MTDIFVRIGKGEVDAHVVHESDEVMAILDVAPAAPGHTIVFPKSEYQVLAQLPDELRSSLFASLRQVRHALARAVPSAIGMTSIINQGPAAGQRAPHVLVHTIPRHEGDALFDRPSLDRIPEPDTQELLAPILSLEDPTLSISIPYDRCAEAEVLIVDASVDLFEELSSERLDRFAAIVNAVAMTLFERLGAEGSSIMIESGSSQSVLGAQARIIPRFEQDGLDLTWSTSEPTDLRAMRDRIVSSMGGSEVAPPSAQPTESKQENYLLKQLRRIP